MAAAIHTRVQSDPFDIGAEHDALARAGRADMGAIASFVGYVRDDGGLLDLMLEHYPGMTDDSVAALASKAETRFPDVTGSVVHRYGVLTPGAPIVLIVAASRHRQSALDAVAFLIDHLKTDVVFWKRERYRDGRVVWIEAFDTDAQRQARWQ